METNPNRDAYRELIESYEKNILQRGYNLLGVSERLDSTLFYKFFENKKGEKWIDWKLCVGPGIYQDATSSDLKEISREFGLNLPIESVNKDEIADIVNQAKLIPKTV